MRRRIWHRVLNALERAQVDLTIRVVKQVRSPLLAKVLDSIIKKLSAALQSKVAVMVKTVGFRQARRLSEIAQSWGNNAAKMWIYDRKFAKFLAIMHLNAFSMNTFHTGRAA
jgi:CHASE3 domain sensor protein